MIAATLIKMSFMLNQITFDIKKIEVAKPTIKIEQYYYQNPVLEIPKINLKKEVYPNNQEKNTVSKNIQVIEGSNMPNIQNGNFILAAHSGNSDIAYFKDLDKISQNNEIYVYYQNRKYRYIIGDIYDVLKTGYVEIKRNRNKSTITLITCKKGTNLQTVYIGYLINTTVIPA